MRRIKIFRGDSPQEIEEKVNKWFDSMSDGSKVENVCYSHCPGVYETPNTIGYDFSIAIIFRPKGL